MNKQKRKIYSAKERKKAIQRVKAGESVTIVAKDIGIARKTLYSWSERYDEAANRNKTTSLESNYVSGSKHHNSASKELKYKVFTLVVKHPGWSITKYAKKLSEGRHGVYNLLKRHDLTTVDARLAFSNLYYGPGKLETDIKLSIVRAIECEDITVSEAAREHNVSRKTIYSWIKRYHSSDDLNPAYVSGSEHPRSFAQSDIKTILDTVKQYPSRSIHELARLTDYSSHGIYNVLRKHDLTTKDKRRAYTQGTDFVQPKLAGAADRVKSVFEQFTPQKAPAPPPIFAQLAKTFSISAFVSSLVFLTFGYWINLIVTAPSVSFGIGIMFAGISLLMGTFFFLYSFKYYITLAIVLSYSQASDEFNDASRGNLLQKIFGITTQGDNRRQISSMAVGLESNLDHINLSRHPYVSVQIPFFNEKYVAERAIIAATNFDYQGDYEVMVCDDSTDETTQIIHKYLDENCIQGKKGVKIRKEEGWELRAAEVKPGVTLKHLHRTSRSGFKGAALKLALTLVDERTEFISIFDADFVPYPDSLTLFLKYFKAQNQGKETYTDSNVAVVQGYQWHVLNKSENWITRGVRSEYSGSYVIERSGQEVYGGLKHISGSVYMIRKDVLEEVGWDSSITEDYELTLKLYEAGYKVVYTPYIQAPAECVSTLKRLIRQRMRWAEGHSYNVKVMWKRLLYGRWEEKQNKDNTVTKEFIPSPLTFAEKMEFMFNIPYYLQAFFFIIGTLAWLLSEAIFPARFPFWTSLWGWSLVLTNMFALPLMNAVGLFLEESEERDYSGLPSFVLLSYLVVPFQAYAAMKGFLEKEEGGWFRTPKTGVITDVFKRGTFYRIVEGILPSRSSVARSVKTSLPSNLNQYLALSTANNRFNSFSVRPGRVKWVGKLVMVVLLSMSLLLNSMAVEVDEVSADIGSGDGHDGALTTDFSSFEYEAVNATSGSGQANADRIEVASTTGIASGDEVLVIQMTGTGAGDWEVCDVSSISTNDYVDCAADLSNTYQSSGAQLVVMPQWTNVTLGSGESITTSAWDGTTGGIIAFKATGTVDVQSGASIDADGLGFDGGAGGAGPSGGAGGPSNAAGTAGTAGSTGSTGSGSGAGVGGSAGGNPGSGGNGGNNGGGGAGGTGGGGAGGTYAVAATSATAGTSGTGGNGAGSGGTGGTGSAGSAGTAGSTYGAADLATMFLGSGGGGGASGASGGGGGGRSGQTGGNGGAGGAGGDGGAGGGIVAIFAETITVTSTGSISSDGEAGNAGADGVIGANSGTPTASGAGGGGAPGGGGGGGSGGSVFIRGDAVTLGTNLVSASAGALGAGGTTGGAGGSSLVAGGAGSAGAGGGGSTRNVSGSAASGGSAGGGSAGGVGRIHVEYVTISGSTTPTADTLEIPEYLIFLLPLALLIPLLFDKRRRKRLARQLAQKKRDFVNRLKPFIINYSCIRPPPKK